MKPEIPKPTILVAEDDPGDALLVELALGKALTNISLEFLRNGQEVINYLQGKAHFGDRSRFPIPGILLLDLNLPILNGYHVLEWARRQPDLKRMQIIVLTGSDNPSDLNRALELGANYCLPKPATAGDLADLLRGLKGWIEYEAEPKTRVCI